MDPFTLAGKRGLIAGIANDKSIAYDCAQAFAQRGASLAITYPNEKAVQGYGIMGPIKTALESSVKYLAAELGSKRIRVNALSLGPIQTRAASGIPDFDVLMDRIVQRSFLGRPVTI